MTVRLGKKRCQCGACSALFGGTRLFERHRVGAYVPDQRRCLSQDEMRARGWSKNRDGFWIEKEADERARTRLQRTIGVAPISEAA